MGIKSKARLSAKRHHSIILDVIMRLLEFFVNQTAETKFHDLFQERKKKVFVLGGFIPALSDFHYEFTVGSTKLDECIRDLIRDRYNTDRDFQTYKFYFYQKTYLFS